MDNAKVVYEKKFKHLQPKDYERIANEADVKDNLYEHRDSEAFCKRLFENTVRVVLPERLENYGFFIAMAREVAEYNEVDTVVTEYEDRFVAEFRFSCDSTNFGLKDIIQYGDEIAFGCDKEIIVLSVIYYTHATYCSGKRITPGSNLPLILL